MTAVHFIGLLLLTLAAGATWLGRRTTSVRAALLVWLAYVVSLGGGAALLAP